MVEKAQVHFYSKDKDETDLRPHSVLTTETLVGEKPVPAFRGPAFKKLRAVTKTAVTSKVDTQLLEQIREFCHVREITFASFLEVALAEELQKQLGNEGSG